MQTDDGEMGGTGSKPDVTTARGGPLRLALLASAVLLLGVATGWGWFVIIGALLLMIFLHELGHYLTARWAGMKVTEFFIGFGPKLWSFERGETTFGVKAIPAGAYVRVIGMYGGDDVDPDEEHRTYRQKKYYQRVVMASAGSAMHLVIALVLIFVVLVGFGRPTTADWRIADVTASSPAASAGLQPGDRVLAIDGVDVTDWEDLTEAVRPAAGQTVEVVVERDGARRSVAATLGSHPDGTDRGFLGVAPRFGNERSSVVEAVPETGRILGVLVVESTRSMVRILSPEGLENFFGLVAEGRPDPVPDSASPTAASAVPGPDGDRPMSIYGAARLGVDLLDDGVDAFLGLMILLNVFIGLFNLIPLLPLDGGHIAVATYERLRELVRRDGRRYFVDVGKLMPITYAVVVLLVVLGGSSLFLDIVNPISLP
ncbi:MAG: site-2 protease family protein [Actinobacteria bacterium]|nr:site-2 protease family protein [Actinomycetota bacterium]